MDNYDEFDECEDIGRSFVEKYLDKWGYTYEETTDKFAPYDIKCTGNTDIAAIEVKYRSAYTATQVDSFKDGKGHLIECHKYKGLMDLWEQSGFTPIYWMTYKDTDLVWDLRYAPVEEDVDTYPTTTAIKGKPKKRNVLYLKRKDCKWQKERQGTK